MGSPQIRLDTKSGATLVARFILPGARYGADERFLNATGAALVDFSAAVGTALRHVGTYEVDDVRACCARQGGFTPAGKPGYHLDPRECRKLRDWTLDPTSGSGESYTALLVGDEQTCGRTALVLRHLGLETVVVGDAPRALARATSLPPTIVVVDADGVVGATAAQVVARLHAAPRTRDLPVIVTADEPSRVDARGAVAVLRSPVERHEVAATLADVLELV